MFNIPYWTSMLDNYGENGPSLYDKVFWDRFILFWISTSWKISDSLFVYDLLNHFYKSQIFSIFKTVVKQEDFNFIKRIQQFVNKIRIWIFPMRVTKSTHFAVIKNSVLKGPRDYKQRLLSRFYPLWRSHWGIKILVIIYIRQLVSSLSWRGKPVGCACLASSAWCLSCDDLFNLRLLALLDGLWSISPMTSKDSYFFLPGRSPARNWMISSSSNSKAQPGKGMKAKAINAPKPMGLSCIHA